VLNRRLASLIAAVSVAGLAATGCAEQSAAVRVDDATVSRSDFEDQLDVVYENDDLRAFLFQAVDRSQLRAEGDPNGSFRQEYVGAMATLQVQFLVAAQALENEGLELTDDDRAGVIDQIDQGVPDGFESLPEGFRDDLVDGIAAFDKLQSELGEDGFTVAIGEVVDAADIEVSSRYGSWDPDQFTVTPPPGPAPAPGADDDETGLTPG
jgi:hypothetical protein